MWLNKLIAAVNNEYERRIKAASQVIAYGLHHGHDHADHPAAHDDDEDEGAAIANVPRGTRVGHSADTPAGDTSAH